MYANEVSSGSRLLDIDCLPGADEAVALARFAQEKLGRLDIWVNNAGAALI